MAQPNQQQNQNQPPNQPRSSPIARMAGGTVTTDAASAILPSAIPKKWLLGLAILLAVVVGIHWIQAQSHENRGAGSTRSMQQSYASVPVSKYPIVTWVKIHRNAWSQPIVISKMERMDWVNYDNVPILVSDDGEVHEQSAGCRLDMEGVRDHRATSFMIAPNANPSVTEADMKCTISER